MTVSPDVASSTSLGRGGRDWNTSLSRSLLLLSLVSTSFRFKISLNPPRLVSVKCLKSSFCLLQDTFVSARGVKTKVWTLPPAEMDYVMNDSDSDSDSDSDGSHDLELYPNL